MVHQESIGFVWPESIPFVPSAGGSETYTQRQIAELQAQGILRLYPRSQILHRWRGF